MVRKCSLYRKISSNQFIFLNKEWPTLFCFFLYVLKGEMIEKNTYVLNMIEKIIKINLVHFITSMGALVSFWIV